MPVSPGGGKPKSPRDQPCRRPRRPGTILVVGGGVRPGPEWNRARNHQQRRRCLPGAGRQDLQHPGDERRGAGPAGRVGPASAGGSTWPSWGLPGSGKSTLMNIIGCLDRLTAGRYWLYGDDVSALADDALSDIRGQRIGFIFQNFNLIASQSVLENLEVPMFYQGHSAQERRDRGIRARGARRADRPSASQAERALRRPAAACGDRPRPDEQSGHVAGRRADGKPRQQDRAGHPRPSSTS